MAIANAEPVPGVADKPQINERFAATVRRWPGGEEGELLIVQRRERQELDASHSRQRDDLRRAIGERAE